MSHLQYIYIYISHRIHGAGIYANMTGVYWWDACYHIYHTWILWIYIYIRMISHPLKCMKREGGRDFFIHFHHPSETGIVWTFFGKIKRLPKEVGGAPHTFSVFGFKSLFRKRWGGGFIHWFFKAMDLWCSWSFPGVSYEIAWRFWGPSPCPPTFHTFDGHVWTGGAHTYGRQGVTYVCL